MRPQLVGEAEREVYRSTLPRVGLGLLDDQRPGGEIDVPPVEGGRLADPEAGAGKGARICRWPLGALSSSAMIQAAFSAVLAAALRPTMNPSHAMPSVIGHVIPVLGVRAGGAITLRGGAITLPETPLGLYMASS
jgi:hypothetical protein